MQNTKRNHEVYEDPNEENGNENPVLLCEGVCFPDGELSKVYIGPCGIFAEIGCVDSVRLDALYQSIRTRLGVPRVRLYIRGKGIYDNISGTFDPVSDDPSELLDEICDWTTRGRIILAKEVRQRCVQRCYEITGYTNGEYIGEDGILYVRRGKRFLPCSDKDPERVFWLTVLGSCVGAHRFYLGRFFSGIVYLLTCGLCGVGWVFDLFSLLTGHTTDFYGRVVQRPAHWPKKLLVAPVGLVAAIFSLFLFTRLLSMLSVGLTQGLYGVTGTPSVSNFLNSFLDASPNKP